MLLNGSLLDGASHPALRTIHRNIDLKKTQKSQKIFSRSFCLFTEALLVVEKNGQGFYSVYLVVRTVVIVVLLFTVFGSADVLASRSRKIYHKLYHFLRNAIAGSDLLVKETAVPQGKKVPKNYFLLLKR